MMYRDWTTHVPLIYVRDRETGIEHLVGSDVHDTLEAVEGAQFLMYSNMQNCEDSTGAYRFKAVKQGYPGYGYEYIVKMVPWAEAVKLYKKIDREYRKAWKRRLEIVGISAKEYRKRSQEDD
ncbi:hypothetical protein SAMN02745671_01011 [Anaerovibrio lipolyticus DSM 3074]|uniref:Uncharacterized protein n=1 Tax=Anaerovibrio lipolyticus DSM 3074 TaxID=1120997 RepID=A0A1M6C5I0_9FIRM|nr:hypothetical protein [Anaerovibrio lipolyticus]SHI56280.1 hypothetical protein SAMN02745671_01011 [Anaerovibrio lipolyticus DSM 3074]